MRTRLLQHRYIQTNSVIFNVFSTCVVQEQFVLAVVKCIFSFSSIVLCPHVSVLPHDSENSFQHQYFLGVVLNIVTTVKCSTHRGKLSAHVLS